MQLGGLLVDDLHQRRKAKHLGSIHLSDSKRASTRDLWDSQKSLRLAPAILQRFEELGR